MGIQLSKRLKMVADCVAVGVHLADVGCDHAYLSIYLVENGIAAGSVAMDINKGPLMKAKENIKRYGYADKIDTRLSDGLLELKKGEADSIVIAGMGGGLMVSILTEGISCVDEAEEIILQPQSEAFKVRRFLHSIGFCIVYENMCIDDEKFYVVMKAVRSGKEVSSVKLTRLEEEYGAYLLEQKHEILHKYLYKERSAAAELLILLREHPTERSKVRQKECEERIKLIDEALSLFQCA